MTDFVFIHPYGRNSTALTHAEERIRNSENTMLETIESMQTMLGLKITAVEDRSLLLTFTHLNSSDPEAEFTVTIVSEEGRYRGMSNSFATSLNKSICPDHQLCFLTKDNEWLTIPLSSLLRPV